jgi:hypothetical protein
VVTFTSLLGGTVTSTSHQTVTFSEFEQFNTFNTPLNGLDFVVDMATLGFAGGGADTIDLQRGLTGGQLTVQIRINGNLIFELEERTLDSLRFIGSGDNETLQFTETANGIVTLTGPLGGVNDGVETANNNPNIPGLPDIQFDGNLGSDAVNYVFMAGGTLFNQTYAMGNGIGGGAGVGTSEGEILTQDTVAATQFNRVYFTGLEPISSSMAGGTLTILGDTTANVIEVVDSPAAGNTRVQDNTGPFEFFDFAAISFTTLEIYGMTAADIVVLLSLDGAEISLTTIRLDGDSNLGGDASADTLVVRSTTNLLTAASVVQMFGGMGNDTFILDGDGNGNFATGTVNLIQVPVQVSPAGDEGGTDRLFVVDSDDPNGDTVTVTTNAIEGITGEATATADVTYGAGDQVETVTVFTSNNAAGNDTVDVRSTRTGTVYSLATQNGADTINITSAAPVLTGGASGTLDTILGQVRIDTGLGADALNLSDYNDVDADAYGITQVGPGIQTAVDFSGIAPLDDDVLYNAAIVDVGGNTINAANAATLENFRLIGSNNGNNTYNINDTRQQHVPRLFGQRPVQPDDCRAHRPKRRSRRADRQRGDRRQRPGGQQRDARPADDQRQQRRLCPQSELRLPRYAGQLGHPGRRGGAGPVRRQWRRRLGAECADDGDDHLQQHGRQRHGARHRHVGGRQPDRRAAQQ